MRTRRRRCRRSRGRHRSSTAPRPLHHGRAVVGLPGLKSVQYWLRPDTGGNGKLADDDPAWQGAVWQVVYYRSSALMTGRATCRPAFRLKEIWGFDPQTGKPKSWPLRHSVATWTMTLEGHEARDL